MPLNLECQQGKAKKKQNRRKVMKDMKSTKSGVGIKTGQPPGRWMAPGIGVGAALGILFGNFILGPVVSYQTTGYILGMSMGAALGLVSGLLLSSGQGRKAVSKKRRKTDANILTQILIHAEEPMDISK